MENREYYSTRRSWGKKLRGNGYLGTQSKIRTDFKPKCAATNPKFYYENKILTNCLVLGRYWIEI